ncbi:MAG: sigma-70 family RNA polymerase sigma factor [Chloroflexota bacterium]
MPIVLETVGRLATDMVRRTTLSRSLADERFLELARHGLDRAYRLAGLFLGDADEAADATQDALVRAWRSSGSIRDDTVFDAWFDRILVNVCRDRLRRRRRIRFIAIDEKTESIHLPDPFRAMVETDEIYRALQTLDPDLRAVIILRFWADLTVDAIAARLGIPAGTVKSRLHRALRELDRELVRSNETEAPT